MGWPEKTGTLKKFYPTSVLVTGFDILFFWVARMIMMGMKFMDDVPFRHVYIHALVRDADGQKMSKSRGNVIDPLVMIERYGADAFRFTLTAFATMGRDIKLAEDRVEGYRNFINKIWNASKLVLYHLEKAPLSNITKTQPPQEDHNRWIRSRLAEVTVRTRQALDEYRFNEAAHCLYQFFWHEFCDWYLEMSKPFFYGDHGEEVLKETVITATSVLDTFLRLLHPIMPFLTEEIWHRIPGTEESIMISAYPEARMEDRDYEAEEAMDLVIEFITAIRNLRTELGVPPGSRVRATLICKDPDIATAVKKSSEQISRLARLAALEFAASRGEEKGASAAVVRGHVVLVATADDLDKDVEKERLNKELGKVTAELEKVESKLENSQFLEKAPEDVVRKNQDLLHQLRSQKEELLENLERLDA
jgi:valyl-tRNA synthetase